MYTFNYNFWCLRNFFLLHFCNLDFYIINFKLLIYAFENSVFIRIYHETCNLKVIRLTCYYKILYTVRPKNIDNPCLKVNQSDSNLK